MVEEKVTKTDFLIWVVSFSPLSFLQISKHNQSGESIPHTRIFLQTNKQTNKQTKRLFTKGTPILSELALSYLSSNRRQCLPVTSFSDLQSKTEEYSFILGERHWSLQEDILFQSFIFSKIKCLKCPRTEPLIPTLWMEKLHI